MLGKHKFKNGQRVRLSREGQEAHLFPKTRLDQTGTVLKVDRFNSPTILWEGRKTASSYYAGFIEPDRRRLRKPQQQA